VPSSGRLRAVRLPLWRDVGVCWGCSVCRRPFRGQGSLRDAGTEGDPLGRLNTRLTIRPSCPRSPFGRPVTSAGSPMTSCSVPSGNRRSTNRRPTRPIHSIPPTARSTSRATQSTWTGSTGIPSSPTRLASTTPSVPSRIGTPASGRHDRPGPGGGSARWSGRVADGRTGLRYPRVPCQRPLVSLEVGVAPDPVPWSPRN